MRFTIRYREGGYTVSVPNYDGGEVVTADEADLHREHAEKLADALDRFFYDLVFTAPEAISMRLNQLGQRIEEPMKALGYPKDRAAA